jgi:hypothetical protein
MYTHHSYTGLSLFMATVSIHFPLPYLAYKILTCNKKHILEVTLVCEQQEAISSIVFKYGVNP